MVKGKCEFRPGCELIDCQPNNTCIEDKWGVGKCTCIEGYKRIFPSKKCVPKKPGCAAITCLVGSDCVENKFGEGRCVGPGCAAITCTVNSDCIEDADGTNGQCVCAKGYVFNNKGVCVKKA